MSKLLSEALLDVKAVKASALAAAKATLEESFQPTIQRIVSQKIAEEEGLDDEEMETFEEPETDATGFEDFGDEFSFEEEPEPEMEEGEDLELEAIIRELEGEDEEMMEGDETGWEEPIETVDEEFEDEEMMEGDEMPSDDEIYEAILRELDGTEEDDMMTESEDDGGVYTSSVPNREVNTESRRIRNENKKLKKNLNEALRVVTVLKKTINEVNLLNAKLLFNSRLNREYQLTAKQKTSILEAIDRADTVREAKLVYATIAKNLGMQANKKKLSEGYASKSTPSVKPTNNLSEAYDFVPRWKQLANIK